MKKIKVLEATTNQLDWLVAKCELGDTVHYVWEHAQNKHRYSTNWAQGGPIIDEAEIDTYLMERGSPFGWLAEITGTKAKGRGPTRLIAAMRCHVTSKLGEEVEVPDEIL
jgi:hypothetical protein